MDKHFVVINAKWITQKARIEATVLIRLNLFSKAEICNSLPDVGPTMVETVLDARRIVCRKGDESSEGLKCYKTDIK